MRINLKTPFSEKDAVKALGARWDAAKKCWYIVDVADLAPFARWIPDVEAATGVAVEKSQKTKVSLPTSSIAQASSVNDVADCGCNVLHWDDCMHSFKP